MTVTSTAEATRVGWRNLAVTQIHLTDRQRSHRCRPIATLPETADVCVRQGCVALPAVGGSDRPMVLSGIGNATARGSHLLPHPD